VDERLDLPQVNHALAASDEMLVGLLAKVVVQ